MQKKMGGQVNPKASYPLPANKAVLTFYGQSHWHRCCDYGDSLLNYGDSLLITVTVYLISFQ